MHKIKELLKAVKIRLGVIIISAAVIALFELLKYNYGLMSFAARKIVMPLHHALARINGTFDVSAAALLISAFTVVCTSYMIVETVLIIKRPERLNRLFRMVCTALSAGLAVYAGFCLMWGVYYYRTDFIGDSGFSDEPVSVEQLYSVTEFFAAKLNEYSGKVDRTDEGIYCGSRDEIISKSDRVFAPLEARLDIFKGPAVKAKAFMFSRIMSALDFTGFFFPFTAEANVNIHFPPSLLASTVAHELSHQRGIAREQDANFTAVLACLEFGDCDYVYSGAMLAYIHLGNALYSANYELWKEIYLSLDECVRKDLEYNNLYWQQFEAPVKKAANTVYEGFLQSYNQNMGLRSYGACVDLLVNYYYSSEN